MYTVTVQEPTDTVSDWHAWLGSLQHVQQIQFYVTRQLNEENNKSKSSITL